MNIIKENSVEIIALLGITSISIGSFLDSAILGFIVTGVLLLIFAIAIFIKGGD